MAEYDRQTLGARAGSAVAIDEGLRSYMLRVYNYMGVGLVVTGLAAWFAAAAAITTNPDAAVGQLANGQLRDPVGRAALCKPAAVGRDARAAGLRAGAELWHQQALRAAPHRPPSGPSPPSWACR